MKQKTKWKRVHNPIIGVRFFDGGEYGLGYFTIEKLWKCKEYSKCAEAPNGTHWFDVEMMQVRTDKGLVYKMPFFPWMEAWDETGKKCLGDYYNENPIMSPKKIK